MMRQVLSLLVGAALPVILSSPLHAAPPTPFSPNDPYFFPGTDHGAATGYYGQWHLVNQMPVSENNAGYDINVFGAWNRGLTGRGVVIGVLDSGIELTHPDLQFQADGVTRKFLNEYSWDFNQSVEENQASSFRGATVAGGEPTLYAHGTASAGTAAAAGGNGIGVTGVAPNASFGSLQLNDYHPSTTTEQAMAAGMRFQGQTGAGGVDPYAPVDWSAFGENGPPIRVKTMSMGGPLPFMENGAFGKSALIAAAIAESTSHGVIHVTSAGNGRGKNVEDSNRFFSTAVPHVISVAALGSDGEYAAYSSFGTNVFVTAPSSSYAALYGIATTDTLGNSGFNPHVGEPFLPTATEYTSRYGGTSAAAPIVAGVMALGVEANSRLNARMAQHLLVRTSRVVDPDDASDTGGWVTNKAGFKFNANYGFGLIDADAFTQRATEVVSLSEQVVHSSGTTELERAFTQKTLSFTQTVEVEDPLPIEYVRVTLHISGLQVDQAQYEGGIGSIVGDFSATLRSAQGTSYQLFWEDDSELAFEDRTWQTIKTDSEFDPSTPLDYLNWSFISYVYWGESLNGEWQLDITNHGHYGTALSGVWESVSFEFGTGSIEMIPEPSIGLLLGLAGGIGFWWHRRQRVA